MTRKLKALGLGLVAALALSAVSASAASAENDVITSDSASGTTHLTGENTDIHVFKLTDGGDAETRCATAKFSGTFEEQAVANVTTDVEYLGTPGEETPHSHHCEAAEAEATVTMNSCHYNLTGETVEGDARVHIECTEPGDEITVDRSGCTLHVPPQTPDGGVTYEEDPTEPHAIIVNATVENITYTSSGFGCGFVDIPPEGHEGHYRGTTTVFGYEDAAHENTVDLGVETE